MRNVWDKSFRENQNTHFRFGGFPPPFRKTCRLWDNVEKCSSVGQAATTIWRMRFACWMIRAIKTHSAYVIYFAFPLQQWSHESPFMLRYTHIDCLANILQTWSYTFQAVYIVYTLQVLSPEEASRLVNIFQFAIQNFTYLLTYLLTPWSRVLLEKLTSKLCR